MTEEQIRHEGRDIDVRPLGLIVIVFVASAVIIQIAVWWMFQYYRDRDERRDVRRSIVEAPSVVPPEPRLQVNPPQDWRDFYASQQKVLHGYAWVSREQGRVRIPIERAMALLSNRNTGGR